MSFFRKNKEKILLIAIAIGLLILIGITSQNRDEMTKIEKVIGDVLAPVKKVTNSLSYNISNSFSNIKNLSTLKEDNKKLRNQVLLLEEENRKLENIVGKTEFLKKESLLLESTKYNLKEAQVIGKDHVNWFDKFTIDLGSNDGISKGDTVIQGTEIEQNVVTEGLVGRVVEVGDNWAKVVTIVDELSSIAFKVIRTQDGGIISGSSDNEISGFMYDNKADVIKGDKIYTSGLGGLFKKDLYIGEIDDVINNDEEMMKIVKVKPSIDFQKLYKVYVISN